MELPKVIYVKIEQDGDEDYLIATESPSDIADSDVNTSAGEYTLTRKVILCNKTTIKD